MRPIRGVLFDFDGPLYDGRAAARLALAATVEAFESEIGVPSMSLAGLPLLGPGRMTKLVYADFDLDAATLARIRQFYADSLRAIEASNDDLLAAGVVDTFESLSAAGYRLGVVSGRADDELALHLDRSGLGEHLQAVVGRTAAGEMKPSPAGLVKAVELLDLGPSETIFVGDSDIDHLAAEAAGMPYLHAGWSDEPSTIAARRPELLLRGPSDLRAVLTGTPQLPQPVRSLPRNLVEAVDSDRISFFAGAGVSVPSGIGGWKDHYEPLLEQLGVRWLSPAVELPEMLQLAAPDGNRSWDLFRRFKESFNTGVRPSAYHFAMLRSLAPRIWTSNYDPLFEKAIDTAGLTGVRVVHDDASLLRHFRDSRLVIKVNGDFEHADYQVHSLDWSVVATQEQFDKADDARREIWRLFEDDFRNRSIVFVGLSFRDPILRRVLALAAARVPRPRHNHFFLTALPEGPVERAHLALASANLVRYSVETVTFEGFPSLQRFVSTLARRARRPVVGVSGNTDAAAGSDFTLPGGSIDQAALGRLSSAVGRALAEDGYRVTSGAAPHVGLEAVGSAFAVRPTAARHYLRYRGGSHYRHDAPAIVVGGADYGAMRDVFIGEVSALIAIGGHPVSTRAEESGVIDEVQRALRRQVPVLLVPQAGGAVGAAHAEFVQQIPQHYRDTRLAEAVTDANRRISAVDGGQLLNFMRKEISPIVDDVVTALLESATDAESAKNSNVATW